MILAIIFKINTTYYDAAKKYIVNALTITSESFDAYSQGAASVALSDAQIWNVVAKAATGVNSAAIKNTNAVTLVLTSADVKKTGFLTSYCGWHSYNTTLGTSVKYSFVGNPGTATSCGAQAVSINGDRGADAMASIIAHEIEEAATDPELNAWYDSRGYENADKCAWNFGTTTTDPSGYKWNQTFGGKKFLIQQNWVNAGGGSCKQGI